MSPNLLFAVIALAGFAAVLTRAKTPRLEAKADAAPDKEEKKEFSMHAFGAQFCEVRVNEVAGFAALLTLGLAFAGGGEGGGASSNRKSSKRLAIVAGAGRAEARLKGVKGAGEPAVTRRKQILDSLKAQERLERKAKLTIAARIEQAGLSISLQAFWIGSAVAGLAIGVVVAMLMRSPLAAAGAAFVGGLGLPRWLLGVLCKSRLKKFTEEFPNSVDVIVRGIKSGLPVHDCLKVIAQESPQPLAGEFQRLVEAVGVGQDLPSALETNLSTVLRARKLMREKIKALSGEAVASAGIIGVLPPGLLLAITLLQPSYMMVMFTDPRGHIALMAGATIMALGTFIMRRMINFKF